MPTRSLVKFSRLVGRVDPGCRHRWALWVYPCRVNCEVSGLLGLRSGFVCQAEFKHSVLHHVRIRLQMIEHLTDGSLVFLGVLRVDAGGGVLKELKT